MNKNNEKDFKNLILESDNLSRDELDDFQDKDLDTLYYTNSFKKDDPVLDLKNIKCIYTYKKEELKKEIKGAKIKKSFRVKKGTFLKSFKRNILIIVNANDNYKCMVYFINDIKRTISLCETCNKNIIKIIISNKKSKYYLDMINAVKACFINDKREKIEFLYNEVCDELDSKFSGCNYCDFKSDACLSNRRKGATYKTMGCCYQFEYAGFLSPTLVKNVKVCSLLKDKRCSTKNISCKFFTCSELHKEKGIRFRLNDFLLIKCFFNRKEKLIIKYNFFVKKDDIIEKLMERNGGLFFFYYMNSKYRINKTY